MCGELKTLREEKRGRGINRKWQRIERDMLIIRLVVCCLFGFYGISTPVGYLTPNPIL